MGCAYHPEVEDGLQSCRRCGRSLCADCRVTIAGEELCGDCKTTRVRELVAGLGDRLDLASVGQRFVGVFIDGVLFGVPYMVWYVALILRSQRGEEPGPVLLAVGVVAILLMVVGRVVYEGALLARDGQTLGKKAMRIKVVTPEGGDLRPGQAWGRAFSRFLLDACLSALNYLPAYFTRERTCFHDVLAKTRVVRTDS